MKKNAEDGAESISELAQRALELAVIVRSSIQPNTRRVIVS